MKRAISLIIMAAFILVLAACTSEEAGPEVANSPTDMSTPRPTEQGEKQPVSELSICGIPVVEGEYATGLGYAGARYENGVLTLDSVEMKADAGDLACVEYVGDLEIVLVGESSMTVSNDASAVISAKTDEGDKRSSLTISGDGSLKLNAEAEGVMGIECEGGISIKGGDVEIDVSGAAVSDTEQLVYTEGYGLLDTDDAGKMEIGKLP